MDKLIKIEIVDSGITNYRQYDRETFLNLSDEEIGEKVRDMIVNDYN